MTITAKDLTKEAPASPRTRVGGYVILARMADKGRATLAGNVGEFHFDCPLDNMLFGFKGVKGDDVKARLAAGDTNEQIAEWITAHGEKKSPEEIKAWADQLEAALPHNNEDKREWFDGECQRLGIDPVKSTLFDMLEADDRDTFGK